MGDGVKAGIDRHCPGIHQRDGVWDYQYGREFGFEGREGFQCLTVGGDYDAWSEAITQDEIEKAEPLATGVWNLSGRDSYALLFVEKPVRWIFGFGLWRWPGSVCVYAGPFVAWVSWDPD